MSYQPHELRVIEERAALDIKIKALNEFISSSPIFVKIHHIDQGLLLEQYNHMVHYSWVLKKRIERFEAK